MGFRNHALEHFPAYMTAQLAGTIGGPREGEQGEGRRRRALPAVEQALRHEHKD